MASIFRLIGLLSAVFTLVLTILMLFRFRKERRLSNLSLLLSAALSLVLLPVFILLSGARLNLLLGIPILAVGLLVGFLRGLTTRLYYRDGQVIGRNSMFFLLGWGGSLVLAQVLNIFGSALLASIGLVPLFLSTGTQVGINGNLFLRRLLMRPPESVPALDRAPAPRGLPERDREDIPRRLPER